MTFILKLYFAVIILFLLLLFFKNHKAAWYKEITGKDQIISAGIW